MSEYSYLEACQLYADATEYGLDGAELLKSPQDVIANCNGVGAQWMGDKACRIATAINPVMRVPAAIHDMEYARGGSDRQRLEADTRFLANCHIVNERIHAWYNPLRYLTRHRINMYYSILRSCGGKAWNEIR